MDTLGPDGCRAELSELGEELANNASEMSWRDLLAAAYTSPVASATGAIKAAVQGPAFFEALILDAIAMAETTRNSTMDGNETRQS